MRVHVLHNGMSRTRIALVPVRSYSGAVDRNRAKRVVREAWRLQRPRFNSGFDCVVVLFPGFDTLAERAAQLLLLLRQAGCLAKSC
jgi:ribonuclease P protein component